LFDEFPIFSGLKQRGELLQVLFNFMLEYAIRRVEKKQGELELNGTCQHLAYADDVTLLDKNILYRDGGTC
jgi:hypothetical protein